MLKPRTKTPALKLSLINDTHWALDAQESDQFTMVVFYRGLHCPVCKKYLEALATKRTAFSDRGVHIIAVSCNTEELAKQTAEDWKIPELPIGYDLSIEKAREWGLFISKGISDNEPDLFCEPALFLIQPDGILYASAVQSMPFARPAWDDILNAIDYIVKKDYPARGEE